MYNKDPQPVLEPGYNVTMSQGAGAMYQIMEDFLKLKLRWSKADGTVS